VTSVIEHPATSQPCAWQQSQGFRLTQIGVDEYGRTNLEQARTVINHETALVTVMQANNETGVLQPIAELSTLAHAAGAIMHTDAAQSVGKVPVSVKELGVDLLSIAAHKLYGPKGVGALFVKQGVELVPFALGSGQEHGLRSGTENVASLVGFGAACDAATRDLDEVSRRVAELRNAFWQQLSAQVPGLELNGHSELRLPNTLNVRFPGVSGNNVLAGAPELAASTGSACHHDHTGASASILAMGIAPHEAVGSVRLSLGRGSTIVDVSIAAAALARSWRQLIGQSC
jgi:cysteine desulfurase